MSSHVRTIFAGSSDFAVPALAALLEAGYPVAGVLTQPDRPAGRGRRLRASPVKQFAALSGLPIHQPSTLRDPEVIARLQSLAPDLIVVAAYGLLLPRAVLEMARVGCVNVHGSLLPRWRGAAPVARAIEAGDRRVGVSIMAMVEALDAGPVYLTRGVERSGGESAGELALSLAQLGARALLEALPGILDGTRPAVPQDPAGVTYAAKLDKAEAPLDWRRPAIELERQVLAFNPWPVAETVLGELRLRIWRARAERASDCAEAPGTVLRAQGDELVIATGDGQLRLEELQCPGKRVQSAREFVAGRVLLGQRLGP